MGGNRSFIVWRFMPPPRHGSTMVVTLRNERLCFMYQMGLPPQQVYSPLVRTILGPGGPCARGGGEQEQSNNPGNNQHILNTPIIGRR